MSELSFRVTYRHGNEHPEQFCGEQAALGPVAALTDIAVVEGLPKARSGKTLREIADGRRAAIPSTIEDESVLERLRPALRRE